MTPEAVLAALWAIAEAARDLVAVSAEFDRWWAAPGNGPWHAHENPPRWDHDGATCDMCAAWQALVAALEAGR